VDFSLKTYFISIMMRFSWSAYGIKVMFQ